MLEIIQILRWRPNVLCFSPVAFGRFAGKCHPKATVWRLRGSCPNVSFLRGGGLAARPAGVANQMERSVNDSGALTLDRIKGSALYPAVSGASGPWGRQYAACGGVAQLVRAAES